MRLVAALAAFGLICVSKPMRRAKRCRAATDFAWAYCRLPFSGFEALIGDGSAIDFGRATFGWGRFDFAVRQVGDFISL